MKPVLCFGEALIDFLHEGVLTQDKLNLPGFRQYPGGAPANAAVAVAKLGGRAKFAGQVGKDAFGDFLQHALEQYAVDTSLLARHGSAKTALAFVMLDETGDRSFSFYRDNSADVLFESHQVSNEWFANSPIFHFCSNTLTTQSVASCTRSIVELARSKDCLVSFDVNLRHNLWANNEADRELVNDLVNLSDIVKFSKEELAYLANGNEQQYVESALQDKCELLVVSDGEGKINFHTQAHSGSVTPPKVAAVDTTAGGDGFVGGLLFLLSQLQHASHVLNQTSTIAAILEFASCCGALAVSRPGAFPALPSIGEAQALHAQSGYNTELIKHIIEGTL